MKLHITIKPECDLRAFLNDLTNAGYTPETYPIYPQWIFVQCASYDEFKLKDHPSILRCQPEVTLMPHVSQVQNFSEYVYLSKQHWSGDNWGIMRHTVRDNPFYRSGTKRIVLPMSTTYNCERTGVGVDIYICDSGVHTNHVEFGGRVTQVYQVNNQTYGDVFGHGTACASVAAGAKIGFAKNSSIFAIQALENTANGGGTMSNIASAFNSLVTHYNGRASLNRPAVLNASFGAELSNPDAFLRQQYQQIFDPALNAGIVCIAAAGNGRRDLNVWDQYPGELTDVINVGGINANDEIYGIDFHGSNYGANAVHILAAGQNVWVATGGNKAGGQNNLYEATHGTSFSTPHVVGAAACMLEGYNRLTSRTQVQALRSYLLSEATTGKRVVTAYQPQMPDRILYLNPAAASSIATIPGLTKKA